MGFFSNTQQELKAETAKGFWPWVLLLLGAGPCFNSEDTGKTSTLVRT